MTEYIELAGWRVQLANRLTAKEAEAIALAAAGPLYPSPPSCWSLAVSINGTRVSVQVSGQQEGRDKEITHDDLRSDSGRRRGHARGAASIRQPPA